MQYLVLFTGLVLSGVAAFFSIVGLTAIFSGDFWSIVIMGTALEVAKLVTVSWLYHNWKTCPNFVRTYLSITVAVLMLITSMGIFGFLSRSHIEQQLKLNTGVSNEISVVKSRMKVKEDSIKDIDKQILMIDNAVEKLNEKGRSNDSLKASSQQRKNRETLVESKNTEILELSKLKEQLIKYESEFRKVEAEVGPVKYVAELVYGESDEKILDKAVRMVILIIIFVFDPLAVLLLIAYNISLNSTTPTKKSKKPIDDYSDMEYITIQPQPYKRRRSTKKKAEVPS
jgi:hypothetical protein